MAFQLQQAQLFTALATTRIKELNGELEPVKGARDEALGSVAQVGLGVCISVLRHMAWGVGGELEPVKGARQLGAG